MTDKKALIDIVPRVMEYSWLNYLSMAVQNHENSQKYYFWQPQLLTLSQLSFLFFLVKHRV